MKVADSVLAVVDPLTNKLLSQKSTSSIWRPLTQGILINARRVLRVMVFFMFTVCNSIFCSVGTSGETEAETASDQHKVTAAPNPVFGSAFPKKERKAKQTPSPIT